MKIQLASDTPFITHFVITQIWILHDFVVASNFFYHEILQKNNRNMTMKWSFSYNSFVKLFLFRSHFPIIPL